MSIRTIIISGEGYVDCKSNFYSAKDVLNAPSGIILNSGTNILTGDIDSGIWAISYLLSMYSSSSKEFVFSEKLRISINDTDCPLEKTVSQACYLDTIHPLFSGNATVEKMIKLGLTKTKSSYLYEDVVKEFCLDKERITRPLSGIGNERFRAMAAIGFSWGKEIFCFPWLSRARFKYYQGHLDFLADLLEKHDKLAILPIGKE